LRLAVTAGLALAVTAMVPGVAGADVRLASGRVQALTLEGTRAVIRSAGSNAIRLVDVRTGAARRVPLRGADVAHVSGDRLATITYQSPDSHRLLDSSILAVAGIAKPDRPVVRVPLDGLGGRVWTSLAGRGGAVVATRQVYRPSPSTPDCLNGGECEWVLRGTESVAYPAGSTARHPLPRGRVLDADAQHVLLLRGRDLLTTNLRGAVVARLTLPAALRAVRDGRLGPGGRILLVAGADYGDAAILVRRGSPVWTGALATRMPPALGGGVIVWGAGARVWASPVSSPARPVLVARCRTAVSAVAASEAGVAYACRGRGAGAWFARLR
jgi:hypothetical protein